MPWRPHRLIKPRLTKFTDKNLTQLRLEGDPFADYTAQQIIKNNQQKRFPKLMQQPLLNKNINLL